MKVFDINYVYNIYINLNNKQRKELIKQLNALNIQVKKIEAYSYIENPDIKHLFFHFKGNKNPIPYFLLTKNHLERIQELITNT